jgi:probable rRNA maturation factor
VSRAAVARSPRRAAARAAPAELEVDVQYGTRRPFVPAAARLADWARAAAGREGRGAELYVRVVTPAESRRLNHAWRGRDKPTNVLSFPGESPGGVAPRVLGDLAICAGVVAREAREQGKTLRAHWAHMVVHGTLHLLGHDHERGPREAAAMERREKRILAKLGFPDPYVMD